jgi:hypothetical protein
MSQAASNVQHAAKKTDRIAMWSGPRNISTALMRSWGSRPDTLVMDEPFYGHYLKYTGLDHPGADEVIAQHETDWRRVSEALTACLPDGKSVLYAKMMSHHLLSHIEIDWMDEMVHCFLIREPREMLTSLLRFLPRPRLVDTGLPQQMRIFRWIYKVTGKVPPVIDAKDVLQDPPGMLRALCEAIGVEFKDAMLRWQPGIHATDGVWAKHWYHQIEKATTFSPYRPKTDQVPMRFAKLLAECEEPYQEMYGVRLRS